MIDSNDPLSKELLEELQEKGYFFPEGIIPKDDTVTIYTDRQTLGDLGVYEDSEGNRIVIPFWEVDEIITDEYTFVRIIRKDSEEHKDYVTEVTGGGYCLKKDTTTGKIGFAYRIKNEASGRRRAPSFDSIYIEEKKLWYDDDDAVAIRYADNADLLKLLGYNCNQISSVKTPKVRCVDGGSINNPKPYYVIDGITYYGYGNNVKNHGISDYYGFTSQPDGSYTKRIAVRTADVDALTSGLDDMTFEIDPLGNGITYLTLTITKSQSEEEIDWKRYNDIANSNVKLENEISIPEAATSFLIDKKLGTQGMETEYHFYKTSEGDKEGYFIEYNGFTVTVPNTDLKTYSAAADNVSNFVNSFVNSTDPIEEDTEYPGNRLGFLMSTQIFKDNPDVRIKEGENNYISNIKYLKFNSEDPNSAGHKTGYYMQLGNGDLVYVTPEDSGNETTKYGNCEKILSDTVKSQAYKNYKNTCDLNSKNTGHYNIETTTTDDGITNYHIFMNGQELVIDEKTAKENKILNNDNIDFEKLNDYAKSKGIDLNQKVTAENPHSISKPKCLNYDDEINYTSIINALKDQISKKINEMDEQITSINTGSKIFNYTAIDNINDSISNSVLELEKKIETGVRVLRSVDEDCKLLFDKMINDIFKYGVLSINKEELIIREEYTKKGYSVLTPYEKIRKGLNPRITFIKSDYIKENRYISFEEYRKKYLKDLEKQKETLRKSLKKGTASSSDVNKFNTICDAIKNTTAMEYTMSDSYNETLKYFREHFNEIDLDLKNSSPSAYYASLTDLALAVEYTSKTGNFGKIDTSNKNWFENYCNSHEDYETIGLINNAFNVHGNEFCDNLTTTCIEQRKGYAWAINYFNQHYADGFVDLDKLKWKAFFSGMLSYGYAAADLVKNLNGDWDGTADEYGLKYLSDWLTGDYKQIDIERDFASEKIPKEIYDIKTKVLNSNGVIPSQFNVYMEEKDWLKTAGTLIPDIVATCIGGPVKSAVNLLKVLKAADKVGNNLHDAYCSDLGANAGGVLAGLAYYGGKKLASFIDKNILEPKNIPYSASTNSLNFRRQLSSSSNPLFKYATRAYSDAVQQGWGEVANVTVKSVGSAFGVSTGPGDITAGITEAIFANSADPLFAGTIFNKEDSSLTSGFKAGVLAAVKAATS